MDVLQQILGFPQFRFHFSVSNFSVYDLFCFAGAVANARDPSASLPTAAIFSDRRRGEMSVENSVLRG